MFDSSTQPRLIRPDRRQVIGAALAVVATPVGIAAAAAAHRRPSAGGTPATTPGATPDATPGATPATTGADAITIRMVDLRFEPSVVTIPADTDVIVTVINEGNLPHYWSVEGQAIASPMTAGGDTTPHDVTVNLPAGTYRFICPVPGHTQAGMRGTLTVE